MKKDAGKAGTKKYEKSRIFTILMIIVILVAGLTLKISAMGEDKTEMDGNGVATVGSQLSAAMADDDAYYNNLENVFNNQLQTKLREMGFPNSGITISCVITPGISREYKVLVYNDRFCAMDESEQMEYVNEFAKILFPDPACSVRYEILD